MARSLGLWVDSLSDKAGGMVGQEASSGVGWRMRGPSKLDGFFYGQIGSGDEVTGDDIFLFIQISRLVCWAGLIRVSC